MNDALKYKVNVVGIGPGSPDYILPSAMKAVSESDMIIGGKRNLELFKHLDKEKYIFGSDMNGLITYIEEKCTDNKISVIVSGDPGFYSLLDFLIKKLGSDKLNVIPGISSFQYLFAKLGRPWKDYRLASLHGRELDIFKALEEYKGVFLLTDNKSRPSDIARILIENKYDDVNMIVGESLSYEEELVKLGKPRDFINFSSHELCVVVIEKNDMGL